MSKKPKSGDVVGKEVAARLQVFWNWVHDKMKPGEPVGEEGLMAITEPFRGLTPLFDPGSYFGTRWCDLGSSRFNYQVGLDGKWMVWPESRDSVEKTTESVASWRPISVLRPIQSFLKVKVKQRLREVRLMDLEGGLGYMDPALNLAFYEAQYRTAIALLEERRRAQPHG